MGNFNQGWFLVFKIVLVFYVIALIYYAWRNISWNNITSHFFILILDPLIIAAVMALQFVAMHKRDLKKAKISLICFGLYAAYILAGIIYAITGNFTASSKFSVVGLSLISLAIISAITFGSFQVYKALKPSGSSSGDLIKVLGASVVLEIIAMRKRDFKKAQLALAGFALYIVLYVGLIVYIAFMANLDASWLARFILQSIISLAVFCLCIGFGAFRVYKQLKPREPIHTIANDDAYRVIRGV